ncbi:MAG: DUF1351 domain-containing protein [Clostridia bacterium]|nr:DUF1351 domain-containing protein [Clostridia bacterium]
MNTELLPSIPQDDLTTAFAKSIVFDVDESFKSALPAHILANFDEVKRALIAGTQKDRGVVITPETIDAGKERCALLRKQLAVIEEARKEVKKTWTKPLTEFESKCKELSGVIQSAIDEQWSQVKEYEQKAKDEKEALIKGIYNEVAPEIVKRWVLFETVLDPTWLNKSKSLASVKERMSEIVKKCEGDLSFVTINGGTHFYAGLKTYGETLDLGKALKAAKDAEEAAKQAEETKPQDPAPSAPKEVPQEEEAVITVDMRVYATRSQLAALKQFMLANGIKYGRVPKEDVP